MTFEISKLHRWQLSAALSPNRIPPPPKLTINDFSPPSRKLVLEFYAERDWEFCETCRKSGTEYKLRKCGGCGVFPVRRTLYCSRKCQRENWPRHQQLCRKAGQRTQDALHSGLDMRVWKNCNLLAAKRSRGLSLIITWAFSQVLNAFPTMNLRETCLSMYCSSQLEGKGAIVPYAYALERMANTPYGYPPQHIYQDNPVDVIGVVHLWIDGELRGLEFADLTERHNTENSIPQWPWVLATIVALNNRHGHLAGRRLAPLLGVVTTFTSMGKQHVLHFEAPRDLDNGRRWDLYDWEEWQSMFGDVINF